MQRFHPTSSHPHFLIDLHDFFNVCKGLFLLAPATNPMTLSNFNRPHHGSRISSHPKKNSSLLKSSLKLKSERRCTPQLPMSLKGVTKDITRKKFVEGGANFKRKEMILTLRKVIRVWCHESTRVYLDRTSEKDDCLWFHKLLESCIKHCFCSVGFVGNLPPLDMPPQGIGQLHIANIIFNLEKRVQSCSKNFENTLNKEYMIM